jgi:uncharacterized membrane protein
MPVIILAALLLAAQLAALVAAACAGRAKLRKLLSEARDTTSPLLAPPGGDLSEVDRSILVFLIERRGVAYQSEIARELRLPKSTVHKALRRLSEAGYVEIKKDGRLNVVTLRQSAILRASAA